MNFASIENDIVARLAPLTTIGYQVEAMPDNEGANTPAAKRGRITVQVEMSKFSDHRSLSGAVVQDEDVFVDIIIRSRTLRTSGGIYDIKDLSQKLLLGYTPTDCKTKLRGVDFGGITPAEFRDGVWTYALRMATTAVAVEDTTESAAVLINQITILDGISVTAPPPTAELYATTYSVITSGDQVTLAWVTTGATEVAISGIGEVALNGTAIVTVTADVTYTLTATNSSGTIEREIEILFGNQCAAGVVELFDTDDNPLGGIEAPSGGSTPHVLPNAPYTLRDSVGTPMDSGSILSVTGGDIEVDDVTFTDSTGLPVTQPAAAPIVCSPASPTYEGRSADHNPVFYMGWAIEGSAESAGTWEVTRTTESLDGTIVVATATGAWTDYLTLNYQ